MIKECSPELIIFKSKYFKPRQYDLLTNLEQTIGIIRVTGPSKSGAEIIGTFPYTFKTGLRIFNKVITGL